VEKVLGKMVKKIDYPDRLKTFYQAKLKEFAGCYFNPIRERSEITEHENWRRYPELFPVNQFDREEDFRILKQYADQGRIAAFVKDIGDLTFLQEAGHTISILDLSNIGYHKTVALSPLAHRCRMIWTVVYPPPKQGGSIYHSGDYEPLPEGKQREMSRLIQSLKLQKEIRWTAIDFKRDTFHRHIYEYVFMYPGLTQYSPPCCNPNLQLQALQALEGKIQRELKSIS
jgi:hypothetical protein